jgi:hypothetical protein
MASWLGWQCSANDILIAYPKGGVALHDFPFPLLLVEDNGETQGPGGAIRQVKSWDGQQPSRRCPRGRREDHLE